MCTLRVVGTRDSPQSRFVCLGCVLVRVDTALPWWNFIQTLEGNADSVVSPCHCHWSKKFSVTVVVIRINNFVTDDPPTFCRWTPPPPKWLWKFGGDQYPTRKFCVGRLLLFGTTAVAWRLCLQRCFVVPPAVGRVLQTSKSGKRTRMMVAFPPFAIMAGWGWGSGRVGEESGRVGGFWQGGEVTFQSVDRRTYECYWFSSHQRHPDGPLRATIKNSSALLSKFSPPPLPPHHERSLFSARGSISLCRFGVISRNVDLIKSCVTLILCPIGLVSAWRLSQKLIFFCG